MSYVSWKLVREIGSGIAEISRKVWAIVGSLSTHATCFSSFETCKIHFEAGLTHNWLACLDTYLLRSKVIFKPLKSLWFEIDSSFKAHSVKCKQRQIYLCPWQSCPWVCLQAWLGWQLHWTSVSDLCLEPGWGQFDGACHPPDVQKKCQGSIWLNMTYLDAFKEQAWAIWQERLVQRLLKLKKAFEKVPCTRSGMYIDISYVIKTPQKCRTSDLYFRMLWGGGGGHVIPSRCGIEQVVQLRSFPWSGSEHQLCLKHPDRKPCQLYQEQLLLSSNQPPLETQICMWRAFIACESSL